ncbi:MAG: anhydro-N-acetylmuramic acid kinase, partial [Pseudomonadota bacterium]
MFGLAEVVALPERNVAGLMTGTSMDGLDIAICRIRSDPLGFELLAFETVPMQAKLRRSLSADALADVGA